MNTAPPKEHENYSWADYLSWPEGERWELIHGEAPTVVQPDIVLCCDEEKISECGITGSPDLVVEVVSPASGIMDRKYKYNLYEKAGVGEYRLVDPDEKVLEIYRRVSGAAQFERTGAFVSGDTPGAAALPGFKLDCEAVFSA